MTERSNSRPRRRAPSATPEQERNVAAWDEIARSIGYNELAKKAETFGERVFCRLARDLAEKRAREHGVVITRPDVGAVVLTLGQRMPYIVFHERDIEEMRKAVAAFDRGEHE